MTEPTGPTPDAGAPIPARGAVPASQGRIRSARRLLRAKERATTGRFLAEGPQAVTEALLYATVRQVLIGTDATDRLASLLTLARGRDVPVATVAPREIEALTGTVTPQGVIAVVDQVHLPWDEAVGTAPRLLVCCAQVRDPGNAGTVIRCADAFGADAVVLTAGSVDAYNPKTVRASVGSLFHLPIVAGADPAQVTADAHACGLQVLAADGTGEDDLDDLAADGALARPTLWLMGNEAWGLPAEHRALADRVVRVPIWGLAESLNLATAAAVCLYATASAQRRTPR